MGKILEWTWLNFMNMSLNIKQPVKFLIVLKQGYN